MIVWLAVAGATELPAPLPTPDFELPTPIERRLSNGIPVFVVENDEVPLFTVELRFRAGSAQDPAGLEGLSASTLEVMALGTRSLDAADIAREQKRLGATLSSSADVDSSVVRVRGLSRNVGETLDLLADVARNATFPADEWSIVRDRRVADVRAAREDAPTVARNAFYRVLYDGAYLGRDANESTYAAISRDHLEARHRELAAHGVALFVGGSVDADDVVEALEARFGDWTLPAATAPAIPAPATPAEPVLYFIDKPGAAQSVIRVGGFVGTRTDADQYAVHLGNMALGGAFTSRVNLNLREDKGYTYGARCRPTYPRGPGVWFCATNVQTEVTGPSLVELNKEITEVLGDRPLTAEEIAYYQSSEVNGFPGGFETTGSVVGQHADLWVYDLPRDLTERFLPGIQAVTPDAANGALKARIQPAHLIWVVVGDRATVRDDVDVLGLPVRELDRDGNPVSP
jgi:zinc protease